jgi:uncharacterized membrane protein
MLSSSKAGLPMPGFKEVEFYLTGLWLLLKGSAKGFGYLDISDRGVRRSFWSIAWSLPAMFVSWLFWYRTLTMGMMGEDQGGAVFFLRMAMIDMASWFLPLVLIGIALFSLVTVFQLVTLQVEFDASSRALKIIDERGMLTREEYDGAKEVLTAAALTYVAALLMSLAQLLRLLLLFGRRND